MTINFHATKTGWFALVDFLRNGQQLLIDVWDISPYDPYDKPAPWWIRNIAGNAMHGNEMYYLFAFEADRQGTIDWFRRVIKDMPGIIIEEE